MKKQGAQGGRVVARPSEAIRLEDALADRRKVEDLISGEKKIDPELLTKLENACSPDIGPRTTHQILEAVRQKSSATPQQCSDLKTELKHSFSMPCALCRPRTDPPPHRKRARTSFSWSE